MSDELKGCLAVAFLLFCIIVGCSVNWYHTTTLRYGHLENCQKADCPIKTKILMDRR